MGVVLVTVTYGKRLNLLIECLKSAFREDCEQAIVVDNGSLEPVAGPIYAIFGERVKVITLPQNTGSTNGYTLGLIAAQETNNEYIVLLDDDNIFEPGSLNILQNAFHTASRETPLDNLIVVAFRKDHQADVAQGTRVRRQVIRKNAFLAQHFMDIPGKIFARWRRSRRNKAHDDVTPSPERIERMIAPFGGMYFHRSLILRHGLPDRRYVLYADDWEFSNRVARSGGKIWLIPAARLSDIEESWNVRTNYGSGVEALLRGNSDLRAYYNCRNYSHFEWTYLTTMPFIRLLNRWMCLFYMRLIAKRYKVEERYKLLLRAIADGEAGRLGINSQFPLS